jgi:TRAP-type C4-dicarboxylate transport system substrate-binding protein
MTRLSQRLKLLALFSAVAIAGADHASAETSLRIAASFPTTSVVVSRILTPWTADVEKASGGELKLQGFWGGSLGRDQSKQYQMLRDGVADIVYFYPTYVAGRFPDYAAFELPYLVRNAVEGSVAAWRMYQKGVLTGLDDTHVIGMWVQDPSLLHTREPVKSLSDVKGLKIRAGSSEQGNFLKSLGAVPIAIATTEMAEGISRGLVQGGIFSWGGLLVFRLQDIVTHHYWAPLGTNVQVLGMMKTRWNALPDKAKAAIDKFSGESLARFAGSQFEDFAASGIAKIKESGKHSIIEAPEASLAGYRRDAKPIFDGWIASSQNGAAKLQAMEQVLAEIRAGK